MQPRRWIKMIALLLLAALCLSACSDSVQSSPNDEKISLPEPAALQTNQILGDDSSTGEFEVTLHLASDDSFSLSTASRTIRLSQNETLVHSTLKALLEDETGMPVDAALLNCETSSATATVNLSLESGVNRSDQDYLLLCSSIANTLLDIKGIEAVNILTGNRSDPLCSLPMGVFVQQQENISAGYAQIHAESERFPSENQNPISRNVLLYFPAQDAERMLCEVRCLQFANDDYASTIISALIEGPHTRSSAFSAIPGNPDLLMQPPSIALTPAGERIIELEFSSMLTNHLALAGIEPWQLYASLTLSLCSFVPQIDAIRISTGGAYISQCDMNSHKLSFEDGLMRRADFSPAIGSTAQLCFANDQDMLTRVEYPLSQLSAEGAFNLLSALIDADLSQSTNLRRVFPEGISSQDILGIRIENRVATINLSARFYARCQNLSPRQERLLLYSIINTLSSLKQVGAVTFLVEGNQTDTLAESIYLKTALMPDWGLILQDEAVISPEEVQND